MKTHSQMRHTDKYLQDSSNMLCVILLIYLYLNWNFSEKVNLI